MLQSFSGKNLEFENAIQTVHKPPSTSKLPNKKNVKNAGAQQPGGHVLDHRRRAEAGHRQPVRGARVLHTHVRAEVAPGREHHPDPERHRAVHAGPAACRARRRAAHGAELLLLSVAPLSGERLCGMRGAIDVPAADPEGARSAALEGRVCRRVPECESEPGGAAAVGDVRFEEPLDM